MSSSKRSVWHFPVKKADGSKFTRLADAAQLQRIFLEAAENDARAVLWVKDFENVVQAKASDYVAARKTVSLRVGPDVSVEAFYASARAKGEGFSYLTLYLRRQVVIGFRVKLLSPGPDGALKFTLPESGLVVQRRQEHRYEIPGGYELTVQYPDPGTAAAGYASPAKLTRRLLDLSAGGLSFLTPDAREGEALERGQRLKPMKLEVRGRTIYIDAQVQSVQAMPAEARVRGWRVGVVFRQIAKSDADFLADYVIEHLIQYAFSFL